MHFHITIANVLIRHRWFLLVFLTLGLLAYWTQIHPSIIVRECHQRAVEEAQKIDKANTYDMFFRACARARGFNP